jgi:hypothetical protein
MINPEFFEQRLKKQVYYLTNIFNYEKITIGFNCPIFFYIISS